MTKIYGVIGDPIEHSISPQMHNAAFSALKMKCTYLAFCVSRDELQTFMEGAKDAKIFGLNVTVPLKEEVMKFVKPDRMAKKIGAVNTIDFTTGKGYNTDAIGAKKALEHGGVRVHNKNILLLGAGGAARAIAFQLVQDGAVLTIANRTEKRAKGLAKEVGCSAGSLRNIKNLAAKADIIINSTPVGMYPDVNKSVIKKDALLAEHTVFDIVYNPAETRLIKDAKSVGARTINGVMMLVHQGAESFRIWTSRDPPLRIMENAVRKVLNDYRFKKTM